tara:strand:+ start:290 stop:1021 length:732 start_codon:yes stop_codon:yes gene_type:complete
MDNGRLNSNTAIRRIVNSVLEDTKTSIPAIVKSYNSTAQTVNVVVAVETPSHADNVPPARLEDVPVLFPQGSDWVIAGPLKEGDAVMLVVAHSPIREYLKNPKSRIGRPISVRNHDLNDCIAITGMMTYPNPTRDTRFKDYLHVVQGPNYIVFKGDQGVEIEANSGASKIVMDGEGNITITNSGKTTITSANNMEIDSDLTVTGNINCNQTVTASTDCVGGGKSLKGHKHTTIKVGDPTTAPN